MAVLSSLEFHLKASGARLRTAGEHCLGVSMEEAAMLAVKRQDFQKILVQLKMESYMNSKLTLGKILEIGQENLEGIKLQRVQDVPWYFLYNLMALNVKARNLQPEESSKDADISFIHFDDNISDADSCLVHPLDVQCTLLHCSDSFLQQEIVSKMAMCQFAVPILLPSADGPDCTFMIWAMRDIVKRWRPLSLKETKGFMEDNLVNISLPFYSFVRLKNCRLSKSAIINQLLTQSQQHYDYFVHRDMEGGNLPRKISDGLVEMSCFFPSGKEISDIFTDPLAVLNLRGDILSNWTQFSFLTQISSAVFIFADSISETEYQLLSSLHNSKTKYFVILTNPSKIEKCTLQKKLYPVLNLDDSQIIVKRSKVNDANLVKHVQKIMKELIHNCFVKFEWMIDTASELGIHVDEMSKECQTAKRRALEITKNIQDVAKYKEKTMKLQGHLWKELAKTEKELCRMKHQTDQDDGEHYRAKLINRRKELLKEQNRHIPPAGIMTFIDAIIQSNPQEKHFFLKWLKILLDSSSRVNLSKLQDEYKKKCNIQSINRMEIKALDQRISESSLGIEHFLRELAQFYEAEYFMVNDGKISERKFCKLPEIASDLLLDGFPLELIDGDASNIPLQWITDVLEAVDKKMKCQCRMRVITVLGVQSTGKSTLLNTMFGLQFPVASGRCTRGAFMTLIKVKENFQRELGCQFILIIDTEGLKALELASLKDSYKHDNELATLVIGLSDITMINMAMENTTEMKDVLQIVVHAFLRMESAGKKPNCQFVHQNVGDVSAYEKNMRERKKFGEQLNEMTQLAAKMEKRTGVTSFSDVIDHDMEKHTWYIPGLWHGVPPMASVNSGYSENINQLKKHLLDFFQKSNNPQRLCDFSTWIRSLWNAVKHENFIFNFRNCLVAEAYEKLSSKYNDLQWNFSKVMYNWIMETENTIQNKAAISSQGNFCNYLKHDLSVKVHKEETTMRKSLEKYFEDGTENASLIERYREEFFTSVKVLREHQENKLSNRIEELVQIQKGKNAVKEIQGEFLKIIEENVTSLLGKYKKNKFLLNKERVKSQFEEMWNDTLSRLQLRSFNERNIEQEILRQLKRDMSHSVGAVTEKMVEIHNLNYFKHNDFKAAEIHKCNSYVTEKVKLKVDYHETYCQELLKMIREELHNDLQQLHTTPMFELDVKLHILGKLSPVLQKMHQDFIQENDPKLSLEKHKGKYLSIFQNFFNEKDDCQNRAKDFCDICLKPALIKFIDKNLGTEIVDDIVQGENSTTYRSRKFFQFTLLKKLLKDNDFKQYVDYIRNYEMFVKDWITQYIKDKYKQNKDIEKLRSKILTSIMNVVVEALNDLKLQNCLNVQEFLKTFCEMLNKDLVISSNDLKVIEFKNTVSVCQFSGDIKIFLTDTEEQIKREMRSLNIEDVLSRLTLNPQDELFTRVFGCGKLCPFCNVPCEAGGKNHTEHSAEVHRPDGLGGYRNSITEILSHDICSTNVHGNGAFSLSYTEEVYYPYKDYRTFYPDWAIQADTTINASDYWKFILMKFNDQFAKEYKAKPAEFPEDWKEITQQQAMKSLEELYNMKECIKAGVSNPQAAAHYWAAACLQAGHKVSTI
ncbi:up-regulator of cell proliferation-like [Aquarana catesbeiana]|uniref:up-regulator of cell proliferation-like n=1 Tax=Aquarana catesbeiana TaxID=8400 RepID=UPI003CC96627